MVVSDNIGDRHKRMIREGEKKPASMGHKKWINKCKIIIKRQTSGE